MADLDDLRAKIRRIDQDLIDLIERRTEIARQIGEAKTDQGKPIKNYHVEQQVLQRVKEKASHAGLLDETAEAITESIIKEAVRAQEQDRRQTEQRHADETYLIIGGEGNMGQWLKRFFTEAGAEVNTVDKAASADYSSIPNLSPYDAVVLATPVQVTPQILSDLRQRSPDAVIAEITSIKAPVIDELRAAKRDGLRVTSFHPMFDHSVTTLNGRNIVIASLDVHEADDKVRSWFNETAATVSTVPLDDHDEHMVYTLGLPHILSLVFGDVLKETGVSIDEHLRLGGTTFLKQVAATREVFTENPAVYHAIQHFNKHRDKLFNNVKNGLEDIKEASSTASPTQMKELMGDGKTYFSDRDSSNEEPMG